MSALVCTQCGQSFTGEQCDRCGGRFLPFIVAEITKNWTRGQVELKPLLCQEFELVIEANRRRGYRLMQFQLHQLKTDDDCVTETIIAVFERPKDEP